ncbi:MAG: NAD(P)/FAD-dependent oxidoreductase [Marinilabiliaceae bacterium]|nr:NAD(P)/FAD-dependent oxidoreductase [Marinilabiliaceae bacterium]
MVKYDVAIVGAGLGGLQCAYILADNGLSVCVVEQDALIGGCLQTYRRDGLPIDTGFHYIGGLDEGQILHRLFSYYDLLSLPFVKMDVECADEVVIEGKHFAIPQGYENYQSALRRYFPHQSDGIDKWVELLRSVADNIWNSLKPREAEQLFSQSLFAQGAYDYLHSIFTDSLIIDVISGPALKMELNAEKLPLYTFAQITSSFVQSAYRIRGGGMQIAEQLRRGIESRGGKVLRRARVTQILGTEGHASALEINGSETIEATSFISDIHPAATMALMEGSGLVRKIYRKRISSIANTFGIFTTSLILKDGMVPYQNHNKYIYTKPDVWHINDCLATDDTIRSALVSYAPNEDAKSPFARNIDILVPMHWSRVERWFGTDIAHRGDDYEALKRDVAERSIELAATCIPGLSAAIENVYTSSPLTYTSYTSTPQGSAYGIQKDFNNLMFTLLTPRTPVDNLYLTGQSLNLHGILGTSMTSLFTCAELLGPERVAAIISK